MLFRIEDSENEDGIHREYCIISQDLPIMQIYNKYRGYIILENVPFKIMLDYWDVEKRAHYNQTENFDVVVNGINQIIVPRENNLPTET